MSRWTLVILTFLSLVATDGHGCECAERTLVAALDSADVVFVGTVLRLDNRIAVLRVQEVLKGQAQRTVEVVDSEPAPCGGPVFRGRATQGLRYIVYAKLYGDEGSLVTPDFCPATTPLTKQLTQQLKDLREHVKKHRTRATRFQGARPHVPMAAAEQPLEADGRAMAS